MKSAAAPAASLRGLATPVVHFFVCGSKAKRPGGAVSCLPPQLPGIASQRKSALALFNSRVSIQKLLGPVRLTGQPAKRLQTG